MKEIKAGENSKTFFFHILKTGGVTFRGILSSLYGDKFQVCYDPTVEAIQAKLTHVQCLEFHTFHFRGKLAHMHSGLLTQNRLDLLDGHNVFTMLRDPVDQVLSLYYYLLRRRLFLEPVYAARGLHFPSSLEEYIDAPYHFNLQTAFLSDCHIVNHDTVVTRANLDVATNLLVRLRAHVGLTERFADSMNIFENVTGLRIPATIQNENRNPDRLPLAAIPARLKDKILEQSHYDVELYQRGREMFLEDLARCGPTRNYVFQSMQTGDSSSVIEPDTPKAAAVGTVKQAPAGEPPRKTVFFHVMKTGGMTFRHMLASIYGDKFHVVENPEIEAIEHVMAQYDCIEFHTLPFRGDYVHMHTDLARLRRWDLIEKANIFVMFREPVDQVVSQYFYMHQQRELIEPAYKANGVPFPETIEQYLDNPAHLNNQVAFLRGKYRLKPGNDVTSADLDEAKEMLIQLRVHPGLTDRFAESLHIFETITGRLVPEGKILNQNRNATRPPLEAISNEVKDRIRELSALDIELYEFARTIFMKDVAQCGPTRQYSFIDSTR